MQAMWQKCKLYFGDGFVPGSSPLRFDVHICDIQRPPRKSDNHHYGVELDEDTLPLFTALGETRAPPCTCYELSALVKHIDEYLETLDDTHPLPGDYSLHTEKGDTSVDQAGVYALRDAFGWWVHWHGTALAGDRWKHIYVGIATIPDDAQIPPRHLADGTFKYLGYTLADILAGLRSEGMHPEDVKLAEMYLWRQYIVQYLEKVDPGLRAMLVGKTMLMMQFRTLTANSHGGGGICLTAAHGARSRGVRDEAIEASSICDVLSLDIAKEFTGVLQGEKTDTVAGDRQRMKQELRWIYARCMIYLDSLPDTQHLRRYASAGFHYVPTMDRYLERVNMVRWPLPPAMRRIIETYVGDRAVCDGM